MGDHGPPKRSPFGAPGCASRSLVQHRLLQRAGVGKRQGWAKDPCHESPPGERRLAIIENGHL